ncbi:MAG: SMC-Scp complex subunit ScpB [Opitutales bacterium]
MDFNLKKILKALLLSTSEPLCIRDIQTVITRYHRSLEGRDEGANGADKPAQLEPEDTDDGQQMLEDIVQQVPTLLTATQIRAAMETLSAEAAEAGEVWRISEGPAGYRLVVPPEYALWVRLLRDDPKPQRLSQAALETLAIVAYRQPVTRAEMESIRGVAVDSALNRLLERELIVVTGRADLPGRPLQYGTTEKFLEFCGIRGIEELPASDVLSPGQLDAWIERASQPEGYSDADMGLPETDAEAAETTSTSSAN